MPKFVVHRLNSKINNSANTYDFWFLAPPGSYQGISTECGVVEINEGDVGNYAPLCKVEELLKSSVAVRRKLRVRQAGGKAKYKDVVVSADKAAAFDGAVVGSVTNLGTVEAVVEPLRATFY